MNIKLVTTLIFLILSIVIVYFYFYFKKSLLSYDNNNIVIIKSPYRDTIFNNIQQYCNTLNNNLKVDNRCKTRKTYFCDPIKDKYLYNLIYSKEFLNFIKKSCNLSYCSYSDFPIEYRKYETGSNGMTWHKDLSLFNKSYYECVLTINNTSNSRFLFKFNNKIYTIIPKNNLLVLVKPDTIEHKVTKLDYGDRYFLKFIILISKDNTKNINYYDELSSFKHSIPLNNSVTM